LRPTWEMSFEDLASKEKKFPYRVTYGTSKYSYSSSLFFKLGPGSLTLTDELEFNIDSDTDFHQQFITNFNIFKIIVIRKKLLRGDSKKEDRVTKILMVKIKNIYYA
jgi:hypothetical protein